MGRCIQSIGNIDVVMKMVSVLGASIGLVSLKTSVVLCCFVLNLCLIVFGSSAILHVLN